MGSVSICAQLPAHGGSHLEHEWRGRRQQAHAARRRLHADGGRQRHFLRVQLVLLVRVEERALVRVQFVAAATPPAVSRQLEQLAGEDRLQCTRAYLVDSASVPHGKCDKHEREM